MLFKTVEELQQYLPVRKGIILLQVQPTVEYDAEQMLLKRLLGDTLMAALKDSYEAESIEADGYTELLSKVQFVAANYGVLQYLPFALADLGNGGLTVANSQDLKTAPEWMADGIEQRLIERSDRGIEDLLKYLEEHVDDFTSWVGSEGYSLQTTSFISSAKAFNLVYKINESRSTYMAMWPYMKLIEEDEISTVLTPPLYAAMKDKLLENDFSPAELIILPWIRIAIAYLTIAKCVPHLPVEVNNKGIQVNSLSTFSVRKVKAAADRNSLADLANNCLAEGNKFLKKVVDYLAAHADDFDEYEPVVEETVSESQVPVVTIESMSVI